MIKTRARFAGYLAKEVWPLCRQGCQDTLRPDSDKAKADLIQSVAERTIGGYRTLELTPKSYNPREHKVILYVHGGALTLGAPDFQMQIPAPVADRTGWKVIAIDYPLAPYSSAAEIHPAQKAVLNVYEELLKEYGSKDIVMLGDSAGGNLAFGAALMLRDKGAPLPGAIVGYEPWVDLDQTGDAYFNQNIIEQTVVLTPECLQSARDAAYGKKESYEPCESPLKGDYFGFENVSVAIFTAGRDLLQTEGCELAEKLKCHAKSVMYDCGNGLWHGYQEHYLMPESEKCADKAAAFLVQSLT